MSVWQIGQIKCLQSRMDKGPDSAVRASVKAMDNDYICLVDSRIIRFGFR